MRRALKGLAVGLAMMMGVAVSSGSAQAAACGDLNNSNSVTIGDALLLLQVVANPASGAALCGGAGAVACGDMNQDGAITIADVVILLNFLAGNPTLLPICTGAGPVIACPGPGGAGPNGETWTGQATVSGTIGSSQIWPAGCRVNIDGLTFVADKVAITMKPGVIVAGKNPPSAGLGGPSNTSALIFLRGSKIIAKGTPALPILMQSSDHLDGGHGHIGDWGGLTINGKGPVNCPGNQCFAEGLVGIPFGGTDQNDSSGIVEYVRVEFSGKELTPDNELNIITLNGLGRGTVYDHVQANIGFDDCQEWFGGNVNAKYLVSTGCGDDNFDQQLGTTGMIQYGLGQYYQPTMQNAGNEGFEWDDNENGFDLQPRSNPKYCNMTMTGTALQPSVGLGGTEEAIFFRRGTSGTVANTIMQHYRIAGIDFRDLSTAKNTCDSPTTLHTPTLDRPALVVEHSLFFDNGFAGDGAVAGKKQVVGNGGFDNAATLPDVNPCLNGATKGSRNAWDLMAASKSIVPVDPTTVGPDPGLHVIYGTGAVNAQTDFNQYIPDGTQPLVTTLAMDCHTIDPFFDTTTYIGAFAPGQPTWLTSPWVSFELQ